MADQFNALEMLLGDSTELDDPVKRKATAAALRRQNAMGVVGQLMGVQPTQMAGSSLIDNSQQSLKLAMQQREQTKRDKLAADQAQREEEWRQRTYDRGVKEFNIREGRLNTPSPTSANTDSFTGEVVNGIPGRRSRLTGEWTPDKQPTDNEPPKDTPTYGFTLPAGVSPKTDAQQNSYQFAVRMTEAVPQVEAIIQNGYMPSTKDLTLLQAATALPNGSAVIEQGISNEGRIYMDAAAPLVNAILRKESGAAITAEEWSRAFREWLPRPGEPQEVTQNKLAKLRKEMDTMAQLSGMGQFYVAPPYAFGQKPSSSGATGGGRGGNRAPVSRGAAPQGAPGDKYLEGY